MIVRFYSRAAMTASLSRRRRLSTVADKYDCDGFLVVKGFMSQSRCEEMMSEMARLIAEWDPGSSKAQTAERQWH